jgi:hypothetical protein
MGTVPSRPVPYPGMSVLIEHLASVEPGVASAVEDDGRALVVGGDRYALRRLNGRFVLEGEPYYGVRLVLSPAGADLE